MCIDKPQGYKCECKKGYSGLNCELEQNECSLNATSCPEGAMCQDLPGRNTIKCLCREGYRGENCEITMNPCENTDFSENLNWSEFSRSGQPLSSSALLAATNGRAICQNDGKCIPLEQGSSIKYKCECLEGFTGRHCEINIDDCKLN